VALKRFLQAVAVRRMAHHNPRISDPRPLHPLSEPEVGSGFVIRFKIMSLLDRCIPCVTDKLQGTDVYRTGRITG
jgi:hypothetical protein